MGMKTSEWGEGEVVVKSEYTVKWSGLDESKGGERGRAGRVVMDGVRNKGQGKSSR
jgi:hypothetical protein